MGESTLEWRDRLFPHVVALTFVLLVALGVSERGSGFTADEGSYAIQAESLRDGRWAIEWPLRTVDPSGSLFPYHAGLVTETSEFAYVSHPAWPAALSVASDVMPEEIGLRILPLLSVVVASIAAFALAREMGDGRSAPWAFWLVACSPLLANGLLIWAHGPAAALAGVAALALVKILHGFRNPWWACLLGALMVGVLLRSEMLLFAGSVAVVLGAFGVWRRSAQLILVSLVCGAASASMVLVENRWIAAIVGTSGSGGGALRSRADPAEAGWLAGRLRGATGALVQGAMTSPGAAILSLLALLCVALVVANPQRLALPPRALLWVAVGLTVGRLFVGIDDPVRGLLSAWPMGLLALLALGRTVPTSERWLFGVVAIFSAAVLATQYDDGGGLQWGGRFFAPIVVPLGVAAAAGMGRLEERVRGAWVPALALLVAGGLLGLGITDRVRSDNAAAMHLVAAQGAPVVVVSERQTARLDWAGWPERCWILADDATLEDALAALRRAQISQATYARFDPATLRRTGLEVQPAPGRELVGTVGVGPSRCPRG